VLHLTRCTFPQRVREPFASLTIVRGDSLWPSALCALPERSVLMQPGPSSRTGLFTFASNLAWDSCSRHRRPREPDG
jgi:hypothetical protein